MVFATWILLTVLSCKATDLGIVLPPKGIDALSQEDAKRDMYLRSKATTKQNRELWAEKRLQEMGLHVSKVTDSICGSGGKEGPVLSIAVIDDDSFAAIVSSAGLISLAKVFDGSNRSRHFCFVYVPKKIDGYVLGDITGQEVQLNPKTNVFSTKSNRSENVDFHILIDNLQTIVTLVQ